MNAAYKLTKREQYVIDHPNQTWLEMAEENNTCVMAMERAYDNALLKQAKAAALAWLNRNRAEDGRAPLEKLERQWWACYGCEWRQRIINREPEAMDFLREAQRGPFKANPADHVPPFRATVTQ